MIDIITTKEGTRYAGFPQDHLFGLIKGGNTFPDTFLLESIARYVKPDSVCIDVGANLGYVTLYLAARCKRVLALEPQHAVFLQLCANLFLNEAWNVTPYHLAAHSKDCFVDLAPYQSGWVGVKAGDNIRDPNKVGSLGSVSFTETAANTDGAVCAVRLDDYIGDEPVTLIKVDAQGADVDVVLGCARLMVNQRPVIVFEYEDDLSQRNYSTKLSDLDPLLERTRYIKRCLFGGNYILEPL